MSPKRLLLISTEVAKATAMMTSAPIFVPISIGQAIVRAVRVLRADRTASVDFRAERYL